VGDATSVSGKGGWKGTPGREVYRPGPVERLAGIFRFQPQATVTIPASERMNVAAAVLPGDIVDGIMFRDRFRVSVCEVKLDPHLVSFSVLRFLRRAARHHPVRQKKKFL